MREKFVKKSIELARWLIQTDTCQPEGNEAILAEAIADLFPDNIEKFLVNHGQNRASLIIKLPGRSDEKKAVAFVGHIDTVSTGDPSLWKHPPLGAVESAGLIHGRGAVDMKSGVAAMIATGLYSIEAKLQLERDLLLCFTADEEAGGLGIQGLLKTGLLDQVGEIIIPEPTGMKIGVCEKGALWLKLKAQGVSAHASRPDLGVNAIESLLHFAAELKEFINKQPCNQLLGQSTASITRISGGIMTNMIPEDAAMEIDIRTTPEISNQDILNYVEKLKGQICSDYEAGQLKLEIEIMNNRPAVAVDEDSQLVQKMQETLSQEGVKPELKGINFYTDMSQIIARIDVPFIIIGPGDGDLAHKTDECVRIEDIELASKSFISYVQRQCC